MRVLGVLEIASEGHCEAKHITGALNDASDGISRWAVDSIATNVISLRLNVFRGTNRSWGTEGESSVPAF